MADRARAGRIAGCAMAVVLLAAPVVSTTAHATDEIVRSVTEPDTTEPETTEPDTTEPESTAPVTTEPGPADGNGASDDTTVAIDRGGRVRGADRTCRLVDGATK